MKVVYIITGLTTGGAEIMLHKLLLHLDRSRVDPHVISLTQRNEVGPLIEKLGIPVIELGMRRGVPNPLGLLRLIKLLRMLKPDIVHTWMYHSDLIGGLAARMAGCRRIVWCLRNSDLSKETTKFSTRIVVRVCAMLSSWVPTRILSCSHRSLALHVGSGYEEHKFHVIQNGFNLEDFRPNIVARDEVRVELDLPLDTPLVGLVARYDPQKNHLGFVEAASMILSRIPNVHFALAGSDVVDSNAELQLAIANHPKLRSHMHLLGRRTDMPRIMASLDVLVSASSHGEAFPNVLGEAMACGVPCVVTDVGDSAQIVGEDIGRVVQPGDMQGLANQTIEMLLLAPDERGALGYKARRRVQENYEIGYVVNLYQNFYESI